MNTTNGTPKPPGVVLNQKLREQLQERVQTLIGNALLQSTQWLRGGALGGLDGRRNINDAANYPADITNMGADEFRNLYETEAIANRVVKLLPLESWQAQPTVYEDEDSDDPTEFEQAWDSLGHLLTTEGNSFYQDERGSVVWEYLTRADILSGIGHFGIILLGIDDGKNLQEPVAGAIIVPEGYNPTGSIAQQGSVGVSTGGVGQGQAINPAPNQDTYGPEDSSQQWQTPQGPEAPGPGAFVYVDQGHTPGQQYTPPSSQGALGKPTAYAGSETPGTDAQYAPASRVVQADKAALPYDQQNQPVNPTSRDAGGGSFGAKGRYSQQPSIAGAPETPVKAVTQGRGQGGVPRKRAPARNQRVVIHSLQLVPPDSYMSEQEEEALLKLSNLTTNEKAQIAEWAEERNQIIANANLPDNPNPRMNPLGATTRAKDSQGREAFPDMRDQAYNPALGLVGLPGEALRPSPAGALSGTDQQYFGVQFGPSETLQPEPSQIPHKLLFLRCFDESLVQIVRYEWNVRNPRFGLPVMYRVTLNDPREQHSGVGLPLATVFVHWSRVIHLADNRGSSEIFGVPRQRPVFNRLLDLRKVYAGAGEGFWQSCVPQYSLETHPQLGGDVDIDEQATQENLEDLVNNLTRFGIFRGMSLKLQAPTVPDAEKVVNILIEAICIQIGCPVRVFKGSERGELASSQDDSKWLDILRHRQYGYLTPRVIVPFIDRLILLGVLPKPSQKSTEKITENWLKRRGYVMLRNSSGHWRVNRKGHGLVMNRADGSITWFSVLRKGNGFLVVNADDKPQTFVGDHGYHIEWPDLDSLSDKDKATISQTKTAALGAYVSGQVETLMAPHDFLSRVMGFTEEEAEEIVQSTQEAHENEDTMTAPPMIGGRPAAPQPGTEDHEQQQQQQEQAKQQMKFQQQALKAGQAGMGAGNKPPKPPSTTPGGMGGGGSKPGPTTETED